MDVRTSLLFGLFALAACGGIDGGGAVTPRSLNASNGVAAAPDLVPRRAEFPPTPSGIHLNLVFNYRVNDLHREIGLVDVVWGASTPYPKQVYNQFYTPFERDGPYGRVPHTLTWWKRNHPDWIEYHCNRKSVAFEFHEPDVPFDIANPSVLAYQRTVAVDPALAAGYDGIDFDNLQLGNYWHRCGHYNTAGSWVSQYTGKGDDPRYTHDVMAWARSTFGYIHRHSSAATMAINYSYDSAFSETKNHELSLLTDEVLDEGGFTNYGTKNYNVTKPREWRLIVGLILAVQANKGCFMENGEEPALSKQITQAQRRWVVANYLLTRDNCTYVWISGFTKSGQQDYGRILRYPEYSLPIGKPTGSAQAVGAAWQRDYSGGLTLVNPSERDVTVPLSGSFVDENGMHYSGSIALPKTSGQILLKQ